ncbi:OmpA family protein [Aquimarina aquimarini]|uniref:OmpA family protein n=1 Tax=Aquimarina aquimarini TaxID=1191734 RepID=UPI000D55CC37|nr:OmpA family protein [Aquimarina aquimarini]
MKVIYDKPIIVVFLILSIPIFSQDKLLKKANENFEKFAYAEAIEQYKDFIFKGNGNVTVYQKLADAYYFNSDLKNSARWYKRMLAKKKEVEEENKETITINETVYFRAAQSIKYLKNYEEAHALIFNVEKSNIQDSRVRRLLENFDYIEDIKKQSGRYIIKNFSGNSAYVDFAPSVYKKQLVFSSSRGKGKYAEKDNKWTKQPYLDLFHVTISKNDTLEFTFPVEFSKSISSRLHESTSSFTKDGKTIYFTRNNIHKSRFVKDSLGINRLRIFRATLNDKLKWGYIEDLSFNDDQYSVAHPTVSIDEQKLYFASDMPGGYGMSDIYMVDIYKDGSFGQPVNLGPNINTEGRDTFPFISKTGMLYFASDGHQGLGGLDIFAVDLSKKENKIYNVGEPINSSADDITFYIDEDTKKGFFASNRLGGRGEDDIYSFLETTPLITACNGSIYGVVIDKDRDKVVANAIVEIKNEEDEIISSGQTNEKGEFIQLVDCNTKTYMVKVQKDTYVATKKEVLVTREIPDVVDTLKIKSNLPSKGVDLVKLLALKPIYFKSNKALILGKTATELDKVVAYMKKYPSIRIEIGSHTDSKGSDGYNLKLSQKRATATANYIISKAVDPSRVKSRGYGETLLMNECSNGVKCTDKQHQKNRRSEFIVIEN